MFQRADQRISLVCKVLIGLFCTFLAVSSIPAILHKISWLTFLDFFSYVKLGITLIKYIPQVSVTKKIFCFDGLLGHVGSGPSFVNIQYI